MNKKARSENPLKPKATFKWVLMDILPSTAPKRFSSETNFSNAFSKIPNLYGMDKIITEQAMGKLNMFQSRFGKMDKLDWWDLERISADAGSQFTLTEFKEECQNCGVNLTLADPEHQ